MLKKNTSSEVERHRQENARWYQKHREKILAKQRNRYYKNNEQSKKRLEIRILLEKKILTFLADNYGGYWSFDGIRQHIGLQFEKKQIRRGCRSLARKGLTQYCRGLWTDEGEPAGASYAATVAGRDLIRNGFE